MWKVEGRWVYSRADTTLKKMYMYLGRATGIDRRTKHKGFVPQNLEKVKGQ